VMRYSYEIPVAEAHGRQEDRALVAGHAVPPPRVLHFGARGQDVPVPDDERHREREPQRAPPVLGRREPGPTGCGGLTTPLANAAAMGR
jgi:hypothetical protein